MSREEVRVQGKQCVKIFLHFLFCLQRYICKMRFWYLKCHNYIEIQRLCGKESRVSLGRMFSTSKLIVMFGKLTSFLYNTEENEKILKNEMYSVFLPS